MQHPIDSPDLTLRNQPVLVVEDEAMVAMLIEDGLLDAGAKVIGPAASVAEALQLIDTAMADGGLSAAVLDINLCGETVTPVAERLASLDVPFLFATGYADGLGPPGYPGAPKLLKPFDPNILVQTVAALTLRKGDRPGT